MKQQQQKPTKAVIYCRVSTDRQMREGDGVRSQETRCREFAEYSGFEVVKVFRDEGVSGGLGPDQRPALQELFAFLDTQRGRFAIIVDDISRVARSMEAHVEFQTKLTARGATLFSPSQEFEDSPHGKLVTNVLVSVASFQRDANTEQVINRQKARLMNGYWLFGRPQGYKYIKDPTGAGKILIRDEPKASVMAEAFEGFATGRFETQADVARFLSNSGAFKKKVHPSSVKRLLTNILYTGQIEYPAWNVSLRPGRHPAIIGIVTFNKIQERLGLKAKAPYRKDLHDDFPLRGFVLCPCCEEPMTASWAKGRKARYAYYHCKTKGCEAYGKSIKREEVEDALKSLLLKMTPSEPVIALTREILADMHSRKVGQLNGRLAGLDHEKKLLDQKIDGFLERLLEANEPTIIRTYENKIKELEMERQLVSAQAAQAYSVDTGFDSALGTVLDFMGNPHSLWVNGDLEDKRLILKMAFAKRLAYTKKEGFGTAGISLPFLVLKDFEAQKSKMVVGVGFEPTYS